MITWMQHHKKWLIVTIWIATIAFVGAGFVGWGAYSYGKKQDEVAKIKDTTVTVNDVQIIYSQLFNQENQKLGGRLDKATAKKLGLEKAAYKQAILNAMIMQFAKDNGLYITDQELADTIAAIPAFQKNRKFELSLYKTYLRNNNLEPKTFESNLKKDLLIQKIITALNLPSTKTLQNTLGSYTFMEDKLSIKTINAPEITVTEEEIKKYWQAHKNEYKSIISYDIGIYYVNQDVNVSDKELQAYYDEHKLNYTDKTGKILPLDKIKDEVKKDLIAKKTKRTAIIDMKKLKKNELKFDIKKDVNFSNPYISQTLMYKLVLKKFLKPVYTQKGWLIAKLIKINKPKVLTFEKAKNLAKKDLLSQKRKEALIALAKKELNTFKGKDIGFLSKNDVLKLKNMNPANAEYFLSSVFNSNKPKNFVLLPQVNPTKAVLYNIEKQKLMDKKLYEKYQKLIIMLSDKLKSNQLNKNLVKQLEKLYESDIKIYIKL